jgi:HK97 gp10 family phage protein
MAVPIFAAVGRLLGQAAIDWLVGGLVTDAVGTISGLSLSVDVKLDMEGLKRLRGKQRTAVYRAVNRTAKPVKEAVISNAQRLARLGNLAKSIGTKTKIYPKGIVTVIGPKMSFARKTKTKKKGLNKGTRGNIRPYLYAHFLERGTVRAKAKPFLKPAWDAAGPDYVNQVRLAIAEELAKVMQAKG